jgi:hypothetical protein
VRGKLAAESAPTKNAGSESSRLKPLLQKNAKSGSSQLKPLVRKTGAR